MRILAVDTAENSASIALMDESAPICELYFNSKMTHSRTLMAMISGMVEARAGLDIQDIDGFVVSHGPGSFTGLRIGISVVKGLAFAHGKPAAGISSLDGIAWQFSEGPISNVCAMMDAKRGEAYRAFYLFENGKLRYKTPALAVTPEKMAEEGAQFGEEPIVFAGSGAVVFQETLQQIFGVRASFAPPFKNGIRASALAHALFQDSEALSHEHHAIVPVYLRRSDAEINFNKRSAHTGKSAG